MPSKTALLRRAALLAVLLAAAPLIHAQTAAPAPTIESFFANPAFGGAVLSPSGKYLAARSGAAGKRDFLVAIDLQTKAAKVIAAYDDADIGAFHWISDERLVFNLHDKQVAPGDTRYGPGLFAVNRDGSELIQLVDRYGEWVPGVSPVGRKLLPARTRLLPERGAQDSEYVYVSSPNVSTRGELRSVNLLRLNTLTGHTESVPRPAEVTQWMLDNKGEPRLALGIDKRLVTLWYREPANGNWRKLASYDAYSPTRDAITPLAFGPDGTLYVTASAGKDTTSVHSFDLATGKLNPAALVATAGYDFSGGLITTHDKLLGLEFTTDAASDLWIDPDMKAVQEKLDKLLPATNNLIAVPARRQSPWLLVRAYSDVSPLAYWLYDTQTGQLSKVGTTHPGIDPRQMGHQRPVRYKARDGLEIPALLTLPAGGKRDLPLVVLVHGGPWVNGPSWGWSADSQFLASRGYAVLEPSFRGTTGLGEKHFKASWKQWGLAMQDDVADGTRWAIAQGIADPRRVCIAGASYGGYATLMGLVNDPDLYKCGVDWAGVTDINLLYDSGWNYSSDMSDEWREYGMPERVGDRVKDAAQLKATSPIEQAARITQPLLLAYGGSDHRVPLSHGKSFYAAVTRTNRQVEWIEYPEEAHGWTLPKNRYDFWGRVEKFLDKNIGKGAVQQ